MFYEIKKVDGLKMAYFVVVDNVNDTSSRLFASYADAFQAMMKTVGSAPEGVDVPAYQIV
jgi:hypothetical protein